MYLAASTDSYGHSQTFLWNSGAFNFKRQLPCFAFKVLTIIKKINRSPYSFDIQLHMLYICKVSVTAYSLVLESGR